MLKTTKWFILLSLIPIIGYAVFCGIRIHEQYLPSKMIRAILYDYCLAVPFSPGAQIDEHHLTRGHFIKSDHHDDSEAFWYGTFNNWIRTINRNENSCTISFFHRFPEKLASSLIQNAPVLKLPKLPATTTETTIGDYTLRNTHLCAPISNRKNTTDIKYQSIVIWTQISVPQIKEKILFNSSGLHHAGTNATHLNCKEYLQQLIIEN